MKIQCAKYKCDECGKEVEKRRRDIVPPLVTWEENKDCKSSPHNPTCPTCGSGELRNKDMGASDYHTLKEVKGGN
jgi:uncharacterized protein (DUF983 family)